MQIKFHSMLEKLMIFKSKQNKFEADLKIRLCGKKNYIQQRVSNNRESKLLQILVGNVKIIVFL